ncbi:MAG: pimeloyl-ACP methyl ester esterase BioH [Gammaproteobacteria bacterium]|nr:pimeloyl-ACP methyl ester esterase BioH [Gammaproteobacteria bacterium]
MKAERLDPSSPIYIESFGAGSDIVLLHGWGMHGGYWTELANELATQFRVHCVDLPGHGYSEYQGEQSIDDYVGVIRQALPAAINFPAIFIGWSMGGLITQALAHQYPDRVSKLVLVASTPSFVQRDGWANATSEDVLQGFADNLAQDYKSTLNRFLALQVRGSEQQKNNLRELRARLFERGEATQAALNAGLGLLKEVDLRDEFSASTIPTLLLGGERDTLIPQQALIELSSNSNNAQVKIIDKAGHAPFLSHPEQCLNHIKQFCRHEH